MNANDHPLTDRQQLIDYFQNGVKLPEWQRIGLATQRFLLNAEDGNYLPYEGTRSLSGFLNHLTAFGWQPHDEHGHIIGVTRKHSALTLGPGGQLTLISTPRQNVHEIAKELTDIDKEWNAVADSMGAHLVALGYHPTATPLGTPNVPRQYYHILSETFGKLNPLGAALQKCIASTAVRLDYTSEEDMAAKFKVALAFQSIAIALLANSSILEGVGTSYNSYRAHVRQQVDPAASTICRLAFRRDFSFAAYVDHILAMPLLFAYRDGKPLAVKQADFPTFMQGHLKELPDDRPRQQDWVQHLMTVMTEVRLFPELHLAGADSVHSDLVVSLVSFWVGILYDRTALNDSLNFIKDWSADDLIELRSIVAEKGLRAPFRGGRLADFAVDAIKLAQQGLRRRAIRLNGGADETRYVEPLFLIAESAQAPADALRMRVQTDGIKAAFRTVF